MPIKICSSCRIPKDLNEFHKNKCKKDGYTNICKNCKSIKSKDYTIRSKEKRAARFQEYYKDNKDRLKEYQKGYRSKNKIKLALQDKEKRYKDKYNITIEILEQKLKEQDNKCLICNKEFDLKTRPVVDHDHKTNKLRGMLCDNCNLGLGNFQDNTDILISAIEYLKKFGS